MAINTVLSAYLLVTGKPKPFVTERGQTYNYLDVTIFNEGGRPTNMQLQSRDLTFAELSLMTTYKVEALARFVGQKDGKSVKLELITAKWTIFDQNAAAGATAPK